MCPIPPHQVPAGRVIDVAPLARLADALAVLDHHLDEVLPLPVGRLAIRLPDVK